MATDERLRVTVVGARRRVDLTVPARAAIAEYSARLLDLCGTEEDDGALPPVWSLAPAGIRPYPPSASLAEAGVADGAVLYLRDHAAGELDEPSITDIVELVDTASRSRRGWDARLGAGVMLTSGLGALVAGLAALSAGRAPAPLFLLVALAAGVASAVLARRADRRAWPLPGFAVTALALAAVPLLALAPTFLPATRTNPGTALIGLGCGAVLGALTARLALPRLITTVLVAGGLLALSATVMLVLTHAGRNDAAAAVALLALGLLELAPSLAGHLVASAEPPAGRTGTDEIEALVGRGRLVLAGIVLGCGAVLVGCVVLLALSGDPYAIAMATALGLILLLRAGRLIVVPARLGMLLAGGAALVATALLGGDDLAGRLGLAGSAAAAGGPLLAVVTGLSVAGSGLAGAFRAAAEGADADELANEPAGWTGTVAGLLTTLCVPLALGVFGVFALLFAAGGRM
ncbi:EsaB/YukD family protein [Actinoplanes sp. L3-i22]|uniref:EsaB/YukD family protein n=1 Tax=Actinoplanes sp. L3-i22 TaxID=2836373 RepID=UPI001C762A03|nr:EsaB/YukD family protein [Actinoplanes sp. L3-i22]BCY11911.1 hypothetical protein L3i22_069990 [Actinoplanes sp. L3-i22]